MLRAMSISVTEIFVLTNGEELRERELEMHGRMPFAMRAILTNLLDEKLLDG